MLTKFDQPNYLCSEHHEKSSQNIMNSGRKLKEQKDKRFQQIVVKKDMTFLERQEVNEKPSDTEKSEKRGNRSKGRKRDMGDKKEQGGEHSTSRGRVAQGQNLKPHAKKNVLTESHFLSY